MTSFQRPAALVTGASGFIGSHLTRRLVASGWDVHVVTRPGSRTDVLNPVLDRITFHCHDGTTSGMIKLLEASRPNTVFHLASLFLSAHNAVDVEPLIHANVTLGVQLAEAMVAAGCTRLVNTGTTWQHYESASYRPVCLYAATKQACEAVLAYYVDAADLQVITLKLPDTYGESDPRRKLIALLKETASNGQTLEMSPGEQLIDMVHVDDVGRAFLIAAEMFGSNHPPMSEFLLSSQRPVSLRQLVSIYRKATQCQLSIRWGARPYREREVMTPWSTGEVLPGWEPQISLEEGLRRFAA